MIIFTACLPDVEQAGVMFTMLKGKMYFLNSFNEVDIYLITPICFQI